MCRAVAALPRLPRTLRSLAAEFPSRRVSLSRCMTARSYDYPERVRSRTGTNPTRIGRGEFLNNNNVEVVSGSMSSGLWRAFGELCGVLRELRGRWYDAAHGADAPTPIIAWSWSRRLLSKRSSSWRSASNMLETITASIRGRSSDRARRSTCRSSTEFLQDSWRGARRCADLRALRRTRHRVVIDALPALLARHQISSRARRDASAITPTGVKPIGRFEKWPRAA